MKRNLFRITLALVLVLSLVIGSVSTISAAKPILSLSITITHKEAGNISFDYGWSGKTGVYGYAVGIYYNDGPYYTWGLTGDTFTRRTTSFSSSQTITTITNPGSYSINLFVYDRKGNGITNTSRTFTLP